MPENQHNTHILYTGTREPTEVPSKLRLSHLPMLDVEHLTFEVPKPGDRTAVVFFSKNAVDAVTSKPDADRLSSRDCDFWAVGPKTARYLETELDVSARYPDGHHFEGLVQTLRTHFQGRQIVSFELEGTTNDISEALAGEEWSVRRVPAYRTSAARYPDIEHRLQQLCVDGIAFTSPKGVDVFRTNLERANFDLRDLGTIPTLGAIGPKTATAVARRFWAPKIRLDKPSKKRLIQRLAR